jgi:predicted transcriptional regulator
MKQLRAYFYHHLLNRTQLIQHHQHKIQQVHLAQQLEKVLLLFVVGDDGVE